MSQFDAQSFLKTLPNKPGVYQMLNASGKIIYVGKARDLKKRVTSYFRRQLDAKTVAMLTHVANIEVTITASEREALLLEANLIKEFRPRYNVLLRDDKSYPYLFLSVDQQYPRLDFHRGARTRAGKYFGPYPNAGAVRANLALVQKLFKIRQCTDTFFKNRTRPCLQYQIQRCTAPCVNYVSEKEYRQQVDNAILFLLGKDDAVVDNLTAKMQQASKDLDYEAAASFRDQIAQLRVLQKEQFMVNKSGDIDVIALAQQLGQVAITVIFIRAGRLIGNKTFFPSLPLAMNEEQALSAFLPQYYFNPLRKSNIPLQIILAHRLADKHIMQAALQERLQSKIIISDRPLAKYRHWQKMALVNAQHALSQYLSQKDNFLAKLQALQKALFIPNALQRMECFDISHTQGEATVASCVVFAEEGPLKKDYRRYNIKNIAAGDDYAALHQALTRRYTRIKSEGVALPDLLIIDGGKGQLNVAAQVLEELQVSGVVIIGIAKGPQRKVGLEKIFMLNRKQPIQLPADHIGFHLLQMIRDEAHRFAITGHRKQRSKKRVTSPLQGIDGVGPKRRQQLLQYFGGLQELRQASVEEIAKVPGISEALAQRIVDFLHKS